MKTVAGESGKDSREQLHLHSRAQAYDLIAQMLEQARRKVIVFSPLLDARCFNRARVVSALARFAAAHHQNQARFLVEHADLSAQYNGRIIELSHRFSDFIKLRQVDEDYVGLQEMFVVVDDMYLHQRELDTSDYIGGLNARREAKLLVVRHERMWERAQPIRGINPVGL
jgi:hypothetical protein